ncbi:MAG: FKBP-type peptidyl-prolyl cis-trans isomerase [Salinivirgaceae bacterium]|nr:FKBP-type peptidyl-prolyl cis-trans isomerase [Salinivirgaceae bacterium]
MRIIGTILLCVVFAACSSNSTKRQPVTDEMLVNINRTLVDMDQERIESYAERHNWDMKVSPTGMWYQIYEHGNGDSVRVGKVVTLNYKLSLLNGKECYSSDSLGSKVFRVGQGGVETGLEEAVLLMRVGDKARLIMPAFMAHGLIGDGNKIPARATIVYETEIISQSDN